MKRRSFLLAQAQAPNDDDPMSTLNPEMRRIIEELDSLGGKPLDKLSVAEARRQPRISAAAASLLTKQGKPPSGDDVTSQDLRYTGPGGSQLLRVYRPPNAPAINAPLVLYFHGGGWVVAGVTDYDNAAKALARSSGAVVAAAAYRQAPEHRFPAAHEDAHAAYQGLLANAATFGGDARRIAVAGEEAGGNLAINVAVRARDAGAQAPVYQLLICPIAGTYMGSYSYNRCEFARPLNKAIMAWYFKQAVGPKDLDDRRLNVGNFELKNLPRTTIITADVDPLMFEGKLLGHKLESTNVPTRYMNYEGVTHGFFGLDSVLREARQAQALAGEQLVAAFETAARK